MADVRDRRAWRDAIPLLYEQRVWAPFAARLSQALDQSTLAPTHRARAEALLRAGGAVAEPLLPSNAAAAAAITAAQMVKGDPVTQEAGFDAASARAMYTHMFQERAAAVDPLSVVLRVGGEVVGVLTWLDVDEDARIRRQRQQQQQDAATARPMPAADDNPVRRLIRTVRSTQPHVHARLQNLWRQEGQAERTLDAVRKAELQTGAMSDLLHIYVPPPPSGGAIATSATPVDLLAVGATAPTLTQATNAFCLDRAAESGVYTHAYVHAHGGSFRSAAPVGARAQFWRLRTGAHPRSAAWDVVYVATTSAHGLPGTTGARMYVAMTEIRPVAMHRWSPPEVRDLIGARM